MYAVELVHGGIDLLINNNSARPYNYDYLIFMI